MEATEQQNLQLQMRVSKILSVGFAFSLVWLAGIGSLIALLLGVKALRLINSSNREIAGSKMAWWCIIVGAVGTIVGPLLILRNK